MATNSRGLMNRLWAILRLIPHSPLISLSLGSISIVFFTATTSLVIVQQNGIGNGNLTSETTLTPTPEPKAEILTSSSTNCTQIDANLAICNYSLISSVVKYGNGSISRVCYDFGNRSIVETMHILFKTCVNAEAYQTPTTMCERRKRVYSDRTRAAFIYTSIGAPPIVFYSTYNPTEMNKPSEIFGIINSTCVISYSAIMSLFNAVL